MPTWTWQRIALVALSLVMAVVATKWLTDTTQMAFLGASVFLVGLAIKTPGDGKVLALLLALAVYENGCSKGGPIQWPTVVSCAGDVNGLVGQVTAIVLNDGGVDSLSPAGTSALEELGLKYGADAVLCLVDELIHQWTHPAAVKSPERAKAVRRAEGFMKGTGVKVLYQSSFLWDDEGRLALVMAE